MSKIKIQILISFFLLPVFIFAQDSTKSKAHFVSYKTQFFQIKDAFNYGLVYSGINLVGAYSYVLSTNKTTFSYAPDLAFGFNFSKGIALAWHFKPVDLFYGWKVNKTETKSLTIGPYFATNYNWQLYPYLQSGHMMWFTSIEIGPRFIFATPIKNKFFKFTFSNSVASWASRPEPGTETYFYSLKFSDFVNNAHSNMKFGSFDLFNHTNFEIEMVNTNGKRLSFAYEFEYFGYYDDPKLSYIAHSINLTWRVGKI